jgi:cytochrome c
MNALLKYGGAVLASVLVVILIATVAGALFGDNGAERHAPQAAAPSHTAAAPKGLAAAAGGPGAVGAGTTGIAGRLAAASAAAGLTARTRCQACHTFDQNGPNRVGPNLWNIVGRDKGSVPGFNYSEAMRTAPGTWTYDELDRFLTAPAQHIPGNRMAFTGIPATADRANLIAHLRTLSATPLPLPAN